MPVETISSIKFLRGITRPGIIMARTFRESQCVKSAIKFNATDQIVDVAIAHIFSKQMIEREFYFRFLEQ